MRKLIVAAVLLAGSLVGTAANAMPVGPIQAPGVSTVVTVDWACGRGWRLNRWGECTPRHWRAPPRRHGWDRPHRWRDDRRAHDWREERRWRY